jgi:hypothetical protein
MIYILTIILMLQGSEGGSTPDQHVITTQWTTRSDCEDTEGVAVTGADTNPAVLGWWVDPHSCEGVEVPKKD